MSEPAFHPSNTHMTNYIRGTTLTRNTSSNTNTREGIGRRGKSGVGTANQEAVTLPSPTVQHQSSSKGLRIFKDVQQQQHSGSTNAPVPATRRHIHNLFKNNNKNNNDGSQTDSTTTPGNPWLFMPPAPQPGSITVSSGETAQCPLSFATKQPRHQRPPPQQQQHQVHQKRRQLPFNSLPTAIEAAPARTRKRTNSASSTSTTSVTYLRNAAAAFIATAHQNHFQFPHKVLHPEILPLSTAHLDLHNFNDDDDNSFTSRELRTQAKSMEAEAAGIDVHRIEQAEFMMEDDEDGQIEDDRETRGFESKAQPLDLGQIKNNDEQQFWRWQPHYDPILFPSSTTDAAAVDVIASSDAPLFPLSSYRRSSPHTTASSQVNSNLQAYWSAEEEADQDHLSSVQDHHPSTDHHHRHYRNHNQRQERKQQRQRYFFGRQDNIMNNTHMQDRSASPLPPQDTNYAYQQEVISDNPSSPLPPPPLYFPSNTSLLPANLHHHPDASEFFEGADRASWVSELNSRERNQANQAPYDHPMSLFSPAIDSGPSGQVRQDSRSEQDREVFEVCSRRLQRGYTPSQNIHKALVSSIRSSFLASLDEGQRAGLMMNSNDTPLSVRQKQSNSDEDEGNLQDFQQPWYQPQHFPYHASPDQEYDASTRRSFEREEEEAHRRREGELMEVVAQLEKDLQELHNSTVELQARLRESEERNERMVIEHNTALQRVKEEHDHQIQDTKKRTKRFYDETMRKRQRDEDKRLEGLQEQLIQAQAANKDLRTTIRGLQRERVDAEQAQRDDLSVLCLFIENVLTPMVFGLGTSGGVTHLQAVGTFKHRRQPSSINTTTATTTIAKGNTYDHDLTPTTAVPHPIPLPTPSSKDTSKPTVSTVTTGQCTSLRGQKCMSLLEQFQSALSISFVNATSPTTTLTTAVTTPTTPQNPSKAASFTQQAAARGLQQEDYPKTPAPFRKTRARHNSTAIVPTIAAAAKHGRHDPLTEEHLTRMHETERLEYLSSRQARKRYSDSSTTSSGHTFVAPPPSSLSSRLGVLKAASTPTTITPATPAITPCGTASEKQTASNPNSTITTAISSPHKQTPIPVTPSSKTRTIADTGLKEKDRSIQQCLAEQHTRYQKEIERIKQQCIKIYRQSLEDVRTDMRFKIGQRGGGGGRNQRRRASSTIATVPVPVVATAAAH